jgi:UDP-N-acetylglucosamine--N-acetylmuramyl-(pentapeptide) pyrophosphoryl-undecaprenol N-acetylglucosamine transferase
LTYKNLAFPFKLIRSLWIAGRIVRKTKPDAVVGVGGYAAGPLGYCAARKSVPLLIQEQNSFPGITNRLLARYAQKICVAYPNTDRYFPKEKIIKTGNPVREQLLNIGITQAEAKQELGFSPDKKLILSVGGSGGAAGINEGVAAGLNKLQKNNLQLLWQTGAYYFQKYKPFTEGYEAHGIKAVEFIDRMDLAYRAADIVISRAGAGTISELCLLKKPAVLVPSPYVAEDHQSKNAKALTQSGAALMVKDAETKSRLIDTTVNAAKDEKLLKELSENIYRHAEHDSAGRIADELLNLINKSRE